MSEKSRKALEAEMAKLEQQARSLKSAAALKANNRRRQELRMLLRPATNCSVSNG